MSVIDFGGTVESWLRAPVRPASVHIVNLVSMAPRVPWIRADQADVCDLPGRIADGHYDLVFSNSVIEHVGGHLQRSRFAEAAYKLADRQWIQTPYRYFPIEPHWLFPCYQFLPLRARSQISQHWPLARIRSPNSDEGMRAAMGVELLSRAEMTYYFPDSVLRFERFLGFIKSLIVTRR